MMNMQQVDHVQTSMRHAPSLRLVVILRSTLRCMSARVQAAITVKDPRRPQGRMKGVDARGRWN